MQQILEELSQQHGFGYALQHTADVAAGLNAAGEAYAVTFLEEDELKRFRQLRIHKRRVEWLAGRIAAKRAFGEYHERKGRKRSNRSVTIGRQPSGAPFAVECPHVTVSITHSHDYAIAVVAEYAIGIDLEMIEPRPSSIEKFFFSEEESAAAAGAHRHASERATLVTRIWSAKEAIAKLLTVGGRINFTKINTLANRPAVYDQPLEGVQLVSRTWGGYALSIALQRPSNAVVVSQA